MRCRCGGTGRHKGLKIPRRKKRTGSIPVTGTKKKHSLGSASFWYQEGTGIEPIQMQMPGGHLLAAGLDGGNTTIKSVPSPAPKRSTP